MSLSVKSHPYHSLQKAAGNPRRDIPEDYVAYRLGGPYTVRGFKMSGVGTGNAFIMGSAEFATPIPFYG